MKVDTEYFKVGGPENNISVVLSAHTVGDFENI